MFDTYVSRRQPDINCNTEININRAPTDKSVELLNEFQEKVIDNLIATISLKNNIFDFEARILHDQFNPLDHDLIIAFELNKKRCSMKRKWRINRFQSQEEECNKLIEFIVEEISKFLMQTIISNAKVNLLLQGKS